MRRHYKSANDGEILLEITPKAANWRYISFKVLVLRAGKSLEADTRGEEIVLVPLAGEGVLEFGGKCHVLQRPDLFTDKPDIVYLPPETPYKLEGSRDFEVAIGGAPATGLKPTRVIRANEIATTIRGGANVQRGVSTLLDSDEYSERLTVYEIHTPSGNWSSFPPHRHDARDGSSYHEEIYYYRLRPTSGFAIQRIYTRDTNLDVAIPVGNGDLVLIHEGYHPVVKAPGTNAYYLNFLAGDVRKINAVNDLHYDWLTKDWKGQPITIPL
jgi:5-deoxy-glucuronate isomerase